jgi:hypothetical protein
MRRFQITLVDGKFYVGGFPDAAKVIAVSPLVKYLPRQYSDMVLHHSDLKFAQECLATLGTPPATVPLVVDALWQCAVIHYCKCFGQQGETRAKLPYSQFLPAGLPREIHKHFMALRNKHLIHDENAWTQATPMAIVAAKGKRRKIEEVVCTNISAITRETINIDNLNSLIAQALLWVESRIDDLCEEIKAELERHPYEMLLTQPEPEQYYAARAEDVSKPRRMAADHANEHRQARHSPSQR